MSVKEFTPEELDGALPHSVLHRSPEDLAAFVAKRHGISVKDLLGRARHPHLHAARVELYRALRAQDWSFPSIGKFVGGRDHTSILYALAPKEKKDAKRLSQKIRESR